MKKQLKKALFYGFCFLTSSLTFADWDPEFIENANLSILEDTNYKNLKDKVLTALKGSWCSEEKANLIMDLMVLEKPQVCVEIGACAGSSILPIGNALQFNQQGTVYAIDAWSNQVATQYWADTDPNKAWWSTVDMQAIHGSFQNLLKTWNLTEYCIGIALPSKDAIDQLDNIDFLHLDGDYSEIGSLKDVELYLPKVKSGGYILLSNLFIMINGKQPKLKSFIALMEDCEIVCEIERDNAILFKKY
ncbi:MAG: class I SAM-dependent methyltransferase [Verrucomicrobia bacterium]|nr:class I SAM-dependent methyltransferase [Verrucomicrobiota bacterium]